MRRALAGLVCVVASGCVTGRFPTQEELLKVRERPAPANVFDQKQVDPDRWELRGPLAEAVELVQHRGATPWDGLVDDAVRARAGLLFPAESMHCVARETGVYYLAKQALPGERLAPFIATRCGSPVSQVDRAWVTAELHEGASDDEAFHFLEEKARSLLEQQSRGNRIAGLWFGREGRRAIVTIVTTPRAAILERIPLASAGAVELRGELLQPAASVRAIVNRGANGFARCTVDDTITLPRFHVRCDVDAGDASTWVELAAFPPGRILGSHVVELLAFPGGAPSSVFELPAAPATTATGSTPLERMTAAVNQVRAEAGLTPLVLSTRESEAATAVAPHYFAALMGGEPETVADTISLGVRAGWAIEGEVRQGMMASGISTAGDDLVSLVRLVVERPVGREVLLDPAARQLALGTVVAAGHAAAALFATYSFFEGGHGGDVQTVLGRLGEARARRGLPAPTALSGMGGPLARAVKRLVAGESSTSSALQDVLDGASATLSRPVQGFYLEISDLADLQFPEELLARSTADVAITVCHYKPSGEPWARLVVLIVVASNGMNAI